MLSHSSESGGGRSKAGCLEDCCGGKAGGSDCDGGLGVVGVTSGGIVAAGGLGSAGASSLNDIESKDLISDLQEINFMRLG